MDKAIYKQLIIRRLSRIQRLAKQKRFEEIEELLNSRYV
jgi:hypothetical protein